MGTSGTLDTANFDQANAVVDAALGAGTTLFDSSPMYGKAEQVLGATLDGRRDRAVVATKVWTPDHDGADHQLDASIQHFAGRVELMQVHNMVAWEHRLAQLEARRAHGQINWIGVTHWKVDGYADVEAAMRTGRVDVVQVPYNPIERTIEQRILPLALDLGIGVLVMRPFACGALLEAAAQPPPHILAELGTTDLADALLAWVLGHPAVTAAIPATSKPERATTNARAGDHVMDETTRDILAAWYTP